MSGFTSYEIIVLVIVLLVCIVLAALGLLMIQRIRRRRDQLRRDLSSRPELVSDRAFNRLAMARREVEVLAGQGVDVERARDLIAQSQAAFDARDFPRSYELAQTAHETLVAARRRPIPGGGRTPADPLRSTPAAAAVAPTPPAARLAPHRAESQFQIRVLGESLDSVPANDGRRREATALLDQAKVAYDRAEYGDAFRLALRGRRALGASVEGLPASGARPPGAPTALAADPAQLAEATAASDRCPVCGYPMRTDDGFCRGCGVPRSSASCPACGAPRAPSDTFCGKCGKPFS